MKPLVPFPLVLIAVAAGQDFTIREAEAPAAVRVELGGELFTEFRTDSRVPYLHPLKSDSGATLTRHWPMSNEFPEEERDHPHHRGAWLSFGEVNGHDFWAWHFGEDPKIELKKTEIGKDSFTVELAWTAGGKTHLTEERTYSFARPDDKTTLVGVASKLTATDGDVKLGDTKEGFFALRVDRTLRLKGRQAKGTILDSEGRKDDDAWGKRSKWVAFAGPDEKGEAAVIAIFDHPSNLRHPTWWHARDYGLLAANPFGTHDFEGKKDQPSGELTLKKGESLSFRYTILLHQGDLESAKFTERWEAISTAP